MQMETEIATTELSNDKPITSQPSMQLSRWLGEQITILAEIFGEFMTPARLKGYVANLADLPIEQLKTAFRRAAKECKFFPKIAELRELAGADPEEQKEAEAHHAWDVLLNYVDTWIHPDPEGCYGPEQGCRSAPPPTLEQRILDCARRLGGWRRLKTASEDDVPFLKKDFLEEYMRWEGINHISRDRLIAAQVKQLAAWKAMP